MTAPTDGLVELAAMLDMVSVADGAQRTVDAAVHMLREAARSLQAVEAIAEGVPLLMAESDDLRSRLQAVEAERETWKVRAEYSEGLMDDLTKSIQAHGKNDKRIKEWLVKVVAERDALRKVVEAAEELAKRVELEDSQMRLGSWIIEALRAYQRAALLPTERSSEGEGK